MIELLNTPAFYVTLMVVVIVSYVFLRDRNLPPRLKLSLQDITALMVNGKLHKRIEEAVPHLGLVFRLPTLGFRYSFIVCDPTFAR
jgi:hypothetical protein